MVRINLIKVEKLTDQHLLAEFVEIKMLAKFVLNHPIGFIPEKYTLGKGHMSFFRDKLQFVYIRYIKIIIELIRRNFHLSDKNIDETELLLRDIISKSFQTDYKPTKEAIQENKERIIDRVKNPLKQKTPYTFHREEIKFEDYIKILR